MATINKTSGDQKQSFKQIEGDSWSSVYLPAVCAGVVMTVVLFMAVSCSKKSDTASAKISAPAAPQMETPAPSTATAALPEVPKKVIKKHRPTNATYVNSTYGVSFSYPRKYSLESGKKQTQPPVQSGFAKPGAVEVASVDMPDDVYPETDFSSALLNVSVNQGITEAECGQFAGSAKDHDAAKQTEETVKSASDSAQPTTLKLGNNQFTEVEQMNGSGEKQSDLKYFHLFKNGACYEFALDVETSRKPDEDLAQVDRGKVFRQLERILTTARIKEVQLPGTENAEKTVSLESEPVPVESAQPSAPTTQTEKAQVVTPEQK
jgi:hypothetical protein